MVAVATTLFGPRPYMLDDYEPTDPINELYWGGASVTVDLDSSGRVDTVTIETWNGMHVIEPIASRLVTDPERGRSIRRLLESPEHANPSYVVEEHQCVVVARWQHGGMDSSPAKIVISWNKDKPISFATRRLPGSIVTKSPN